MSRYTFTAVGLLDVCGHDVPLHEECEECNQGNRASDDAPVHGPCTYNCGSPSCDAPEYPRGE